MANTCRNSVLLIALAVFTGGPQAHGAMPIDNEAENAAVANSQSVLYLTDGDFFTGTLSSSNSPNVVSWQSHGATGPFAFPTAAVRAAYFPSPGQGAPVEAEYCVDLSDGDRLFGSLVSLNADELVVESPRLGRLQIQRGQVRRLVPWQGSRGWEYSGPNGLAGNRHSASSVD
jgi:hypothetical protein